MQDGTGAILLRLGGDAGRLRLGQRVEVDGRRSTFGGMESLRVTEPARSLGTASEPAAREIRTGDVDEGRGGTAGRRSRRDRRIGPTIVERDGLVRDRRRQRASAHQYRRARLRADRDSARRWLLGRGARSGRPGDQRFEAERGIPSLASRPIGGADHRAGRRWKRLGRRRRRPARAAQGRAVHTPVRPARSTTSGPRISHDFGSARPSSSVRGRRCGVGGLLWDGARLVAVHPVVELARRPIDARTSPALRARPRRPPGCRIRCRDWCADGQARFGGRPDDSTRCRSRGAASRRSPAISRPGSRSSVGCRGRPHVACSRSMAQQVVLHDRCEDDDQRARDGTVAVTGVASGIRCGCSSPAAACARPRTWPPAPRRRRWTAAPMRPASEIETAALAVGVGRPTTDRRGPSPGGGGRPRGRRGRRTATPTGRRAARRCTPSSPTRRRRHRTSRSCRCRARADRERERGVYSRAFIDRAYARREAPPS